MIERYIPDSIDRLGRPHGRCPQSRDETEEPLSFNSENPSSVESEPATPSGAEIVSVPIPLSPEMEAFAAEYSRVDRMHQLIESEPLDPEWGPLTEARLNAFYARQEDVMRYGVPAVHCRSVTCEILMVTYVDNDLDINGWSNLLGVARIRSEEPWSRELVVAGLANAANNGVTTVIYHLSAAPCREKRIDCFE